LSDTVDISQRLAFLGLDEDDRARLRRAAPQVMAAMGPALDAFYDRLRATPEVRRFFADGAAMSGAQQSQNRHWQRILDGNFGPDYVAAVRRIGEVHSRIGLDPRWYIGGYGAVLDGLIRHMLAARGGLLGRFGSNGDLAADLSAVVRAALLDIDLSISIYLEHLEDARQRAEADQRAALDALAAAFARLADGDLDARVDGEVGDRTRFNATVARLRDIMQAVPGATAAMQDGAGAISAASDDLARNTEQQAASVEETAASLDNLTQTVKQTADRAIDARRLMAEARNDAETGGRVIADTKSAMTQISDSSAAVTKVIDVIEDIAFQTNLLALNAGIEAARAGDAGRGFAVVATEVRQLAQRSAESASDIKELIERSKGHVIDGETRVNATAEALGRIVTAVTKVAGLVEEISTAARDQAISIAEINTAVGQIDVTRNNADMIRRATNAADSLRAAALDLSTRIAHFDPDRRSLRRAFEDDEPRPLSPPLPATA